MLCGKTAPGLTEMRTQRQRREKEGRRETTGTCSPSSCGGPGAYRRDRGGLAAQYRVTVGLPPQSLRAAPHQLMWPRVRETVPQPRTPTGPRHCPAPAPRELACSGLQEGVGHRGTRRQLGAPNPTRRTVPGGTRAFCAQEPGEGLPRPPPSLQGGLVLQHRLAQGHTALSREPGAFLPAAEAGGNTAQAPSRSHPCGFQEPKPKPPLEGATQASPVCTLTCGSTGSSAFGSPGPQLGGSRARVGMGLDPVLGPLGLGIPLGSLFRGSDPPQPRAAAEGLVHLRQRGGRAGGCPASFRGKDAPSIPRAGPAGPTVWKSAPVTSRGDLAVST